MSFKLTWRCTLMSLLLAQSLCAGVPSPYAPVKAQPTQFSCLGRSAKLGQMLLPSQMTSAGKPLLTGPMRLASEPDVLSTVTGVGKVADSTPGAVRWEWSGESSQLAVRSTMTGECDGMMWYEIVLTPKRPLKLSSLRLEIPRIGGTAKYVHRANFAWPGESGGLKESGGSWHGKFVPYVWIGDEERGLAWFAESDEGWTLNEPGKALSATTEAAVVRFTATLLDHEQTIDKPITLRFGLQASPVKPVSFVWRAKARIVHGITYDAYKPDKDGNTLLDELQKQGAKTLVYHQTWTDYYGKVSTPRAEDLRKLIAECHKRGMKLLVYIGYGLARSAPELEGRHDEWSTMPLIPWEPTWDVKNQSFDATCARSGWAGWLVGGIDKLFTDYELDGLYFDGTSEAMRCHNHLHGCGWKDADGKLHETYAILAVRDMMRRIAEVVRKHRPDAILDVHMSSSLTLPTLSFCDSYWDGEQFMALTAKDKFELPLHAFRTEFMGYAHGLDAEFLCYEGHPFSITEAIALAWLHGVEVRPSTGSLPHIAPIWRAMDGFGAAEAEWLPYWKEVGVGAADTSTRASSYLRNGRALLFVSHLKREMISSTLSFDRKALKLGAGKLSAKDAISGTPIDVAGDKLTLSFDGMTYKLLEIGPAH